MVINYFRQQVTYIQWCTGKCLKTSFLGTKDPNLHGVIISVTAHFKLTLLNQDLGREEDNQLLQAGPHTLQVQGHVYDAVLSLDSLSSRVSPNFCF